FLLMTGRTFWAGISAGLAYLSHALAGFSVLFFPLVALLGIDGGQTLGGSDGRKGQRWTKAGGGPGGVAPGGVIPLVAWWSYVYDKPDPGQLWAYYKWAEGAPAAGPEAWLWSRASSLASTLVPGFTYVAFREHGIVNSWFGPSPEIVRFFNQYFHAL